MFCILPFEPPLYEALGVDAVFVGHPKASEAPDEVDTEDARRQLGIEAQDVIAVMPGSRSGEVGRLGPVFAATMRRLLDVRPGLQFVIPAARADLRDRIEGQLRDAGIEGDRVLLCDGQAQQVMTAADVVLQASGTAVLEAALLRKPAVAAYRLAPLTWFMARHLFRIKLSHVTLPNLLTEEPLVPEFLQHDAQPEPIANEVLALLDDPERRAMIGERFARLREELALDADQRAADAVLRLARQ